MQNIKDLFFNRNFILILGLALGMILGSGVSFLKPLTPYIIGLILAISISGFRFRDFLPLKQSLRPIGITILVNYFIYGAVLLGLASLLINNEAYWMGFIVIAATPPAIAVIPFSINLKGDSAFSIKGIVGANIAGILISPLIMMLFASQAGVSTMAMLELIMKILVLPVILSRVIRYIKPVFRFVDKQRSVLIDYGFLFVAMTVIGVSRDLLLHNTINALIPLGILLFMMFGLGYLIQVILNAFRIAPALIISNKLIMVMKNAGFASVLALSLFENPQVVLPSAFLSVLLPVYYLVQSNMNLLSMLKRKQKRSFAMHA